MPHFIRLTPNLLVGNIDRSLAFYSDLLGFDRCMTVPDQPPFVFASITSGTVDALHDRIKDRVNVTMGLVTQFYGVREFAIEDPDGYVITFAERMQHPR